MALELIQHGFPQLSERVALLFDHLLGDRELLKERDPLPSALGILAMDRLGTLLPCSLGYFVAVDV